MLARIYGVYTVKMEEIEPVSLILMGNTKMCNDKNIEHVFDLKGSFVNREVKGKNLKNTATLKDINMLNLQKEKLVSSVVAWNSLTLYFLIVFKIQEGGQD